MTDKEIIQALRICATHKDKGCGLCPQRKYVRCTERLADEAITMIERLTAENAALREKVPRWISVEDRLPEVWKNEENDVLVNYMIYAPEFGADIGNYHAEAKRWLCMAIPCTVTHWLPLPEAPEGGDKA
jgi:hypothetical protein